MKKSQPHLARSKCVGTEKANRIKKKMDGKSQKKERNQA